MKVRKHTDLFGGYHMIWDHVGGVRPVTRISGKVRRDPGRFGSLLMVFNMPENQADFCCPIVLFRDVFDSNCQVKISKKGNGQKSMERVLHITSGDIAGENLRKSGIGGEVFVWRDILYECPREPKWPEGNEKLAGQIITMRLSSGLMPVFSTNPCSRRLPARTVSTRKN